MRILWRVMVLMTVVLMVSACGIDPIERNNSGNAYYHQGAYDDALRAYESALVNAPDNGLFYFNVAQALEGRGEVEQAIEALEQAILRGDRSVQVASYHNLGNVYFRQGRYEDAIEAYRQALRLDDGNEDTRFNLELALSMLVLPTPTPREMQTSPEEQQADDSQMPTPNPMNLVEPTPTPSPMPPPPLVGTPEEPGGRRVPLDDADPVTPQEDGMDNVEDVERLLDSLEFDQDTIGGLPDAPSMGATPGGKDW